MDDETKFGCGVAVVIAAMLPVSFAGCYGCSNIQTSDGYRDSTVRKLSQSGVIFKTWEVETLGDGIRLSEGSASPETFRYSVSDPAVVQRLQDLPPGKRVRIHYRKFAAKWDPKGESPYFITAIEGLP